ncbi:phage tail tip lysozyme [Lactobacillus sp.]|uniref:phage tail tip lysozyme n=1 Tax=Lactobacillus sp. TaxID=1591 RepID=UPI0019C778A4|nr:phage tail tip lysozyme [Lactobacillus sp.]MBD5430509.1 CHAP domain-containing protein [Lactobacillus sp.]
MKISAKGVSIIATCLLLSNVATILSTKHVSANFEGFTSRCIQDKSSTTNSESSSDMSITDSGAIGSWTKKGTKAYDTAKKVFMYWVEKGMSGVQAAGIVGNIGGAEDKSFVLDQKEYGGGGGGLYQFTPYSKYLNGSDGSWSVKSQGDFVIKSEKGTVTAYMSQAKSSTPGEAAIAWMNLYERPSERAKEISSQDRKDAAEKAYQIFGGSKFSGSSALSGNLTAINNAVANKDAENNPCAKVEESNNDGNILKIAKSLLGYFTYGQIHGVSNIGSVDHPDKDGVTDCSGFVWLVLAKAGYKVPADMQWYTRTMQDDAEGSHKYLKKISSSEAGPGDVVIVNTGSGGGDAGHTAILEEKWKGNKTKVIQQTSVKHGVSEGTFHDSFLSLLEKGGEPFFARPIKK